MKNILNKNNLNPSIV